MLRFTIRDVLILTTLTALSVGLQVAESRAAVIGFAPGSFLAGQFYLRHRYSIWEDAVMRSALCGIGGSLSLAVIALGTLWIGGITQTMPAWLVATLSGVYLAIGFVLGSLYGLALTVYVWRNADNTKSPLI